MDALPVPAPYIIIIIPCMHAGAQAPCPCPCPCPCPSPALTCHACVQSLKYQRRWFELTPDKLVYSKEGAGKQSYSISDLRSVNLIDEWRIMVRGGEGGGERAI